MSQKRTIAPVVFSLLLHGMVLVGLFLVKQPPPPTPIAIETSFVSQADLENLKQSLLDNQAQTPKTHNAPEKIQAFNEALAKRQADYEAQMAKFAAQVDQEATEERKAFEQQLAEEAKNAQAELEEARKNFENHDQIVKKNQESLAQARLEQENYRNEKQKQHAQAGVSGSLGAGTPNQTSSPNNTPSPAVSAVQGKDKNALIKELQALIYKNWQVPSNASGEKLQAIIKTNASGAVQSIIITGGSSTLKASLEQAIMASSPLTPLVGSEFRELKVSFVAH